MRFKSSHRPIFILKIYLLVNCLEKTRIKIIEPGSGPLKTLGIVAQCNNNDDYLLFNLTHELYTSLRSPPRPPSDLLTLLQGRVATAKNQFSGSEKTLFSSHLSSLQSLHRSFITIFACLNVLLFLSLLMFSVFLFESLSMTLSFYLCHCLCLILYLCLPSSMSLSSICACLFVSIFLFVFVFASKYFS